MTKNLLIKSLFTLVVSIGFTTIASAAHLGSKLMFSARMNGAQEVPAVTTQAAGVASFVLNGERDSLCISVYMGGFGSNLGGVHLHEGAAGSNGPVLIDLTSHIINGNIQFVLTGADLTPSLIQKMIEGTIYINAHTANNMNGEIRGQVKLEQDFGYRTLLNGLKEVPPVLTNATGLGLFNLSLNKKKMYIWIVANELSGPMMGAHLHIGASTATGPVAYDLTSNINGNTIIDTIDVTTEPGFLASLEAGDVYINLHTTANPNGEIRGQLEYLSPAIAFDAFLNGAQQVPPVMTTATGTSYFSLNSTFTAIDFEVQVDGLSGPITSAHLHEGVAGATGAVVVDLTSSINGNRLSGTITGADLEQETIEALLASGIYINIHTAANPNGEIRGQINRLAREGYTIQMTGGAEVPAVSTNATGGGIVSISRERDNAHVMLVAKDMASVITGAHIHNGAAGTNGPVVFDLTPAFVGNASFAGAFTYLTREDVVPFGPSSELLFRNASAYVNIHNMSNPNGEIRGDSYRGSKCFSQTVGLNELSNEKLLSVFPNPTASSITISKDGFNGYETLNISDITGKIVKTINLTFNGQSFDLSELKAGIYFLNDTANSSIKIIKE
ncbi:MAG: CHRD domain-containing protein [Bacteroidetes bacterium]|nr:CHRD domain-containing protein [Bacteroidota bacterium]